LIENLFFNPKRYDLAKVGRHKVDKKLGPAEGEVLKQRRAHHRAAGELDNPDKKGWEQFRYRILAPQAKDETGSGAPKYKGVLTYEDMLKTVAYLVNLHAGAEGFDPDDIDHFGNRRLRSVGELIQNQIRIGLSRMERAVKERLTTQDGKVTTKIDYLSADEEDRHVIAQANSPYDSSTGRLSESVLVRRKGGEVDSVSPEDVDYMDVSPKQLVSVPAALIPFLEHDDANR